MTHETEQRMKFGVFIGPYHKHTLDPTMGLQQDLELIDHLDRLGYDEVWVGEHHSGGIETIAQPELMIAAASQRTSRIKLGTGVASLPYHHPLMVADRIVQLDHMTRGRVMFGVGPGQLVDDATMMGIEPSTQRGRMEESLDAILRLFAGETVTQKTDWFTLNEAVLQLLPYSKLDVAVVGSVSPTGPKLAGRYGTSMLSLAATDPVGIERLADHWDIVETEAGENGRQVSRANWRLMGPMHVAESLQQARKDAEYGLKYLLEYLAHVNPTPYTTFPSHTEAFDYVNNAGRGVFGTPEMAIAQIERLIEKSGGFGTYLFHGADYVDFPAMKRSYELFAQEVMPHFQGKLPPLKKSYDLVVNRGKYGAEVTARSQAEAAERYRLEREQGRPTS